jgi:hypothetical protein
MTATKISILVAALFASSQAQAENWFTNKTYWFIVDRDSIRRGADNLVYFRSDDHTMTWDNAADCDKRTLFTLKMVVPAKLKQWMPTDTPYPDWRSEGRPVVKGSMGEAELLYVCGQV